MRRFNAPFLLLTVLCYIPAMTETAMRPADDPLLKRFRATLAEIYGERLERVILYGSRARGDAREDSDYDVAVFVRDMPDRIAELYRLADLSTAILSDGGPFIHAMAYPVGSYNDPRMPLMYAIRTEGIDL
jgi:uncharacterized protein